MSRKVLSAKEKLIEEISYLTEDNWCKVQRYVAKLRQLERMDAKEFNALVSAGIAFYRTGNAETYGTIACSFCGKTQEDVKKLIVGNRSYICDECIDLCNEILEETDAEADLKKE